VTDPALGPARSGARDHVRPASREGVPESEPLRWGVIGASAQVAQRALLPALAASPRARLVAVASQRGTPDRDYATFGAARAHRSYPALLEDPAVEAVYVPLPNALHREWVERAAAAGRHVLGEKPLAPTAADARVMDMACRAAGVHLAEAYMTPFHPRAEALGALLESGVLGAPRFGHAAFTGVLDRPEDHRWHPAMGGGALLDVGIYCLAPLLAAAGRPPVRVHAAARRAPSGVDAAFSGWLDFGDGFAAVIECAFDAPERQRLEIVGTRAAVSLERAHTPGLDDSRLTLRFRDGREDVRVIAGADPYRGMIEHFHDVVRGLASPRRPVSESIALLAVIDRLRAAAGFGPAPDAPPGPGRPEAGDRRHEGLGVGAPAAGAGGAA
jgi:predicted dehydrogenase